MTTLEKSFKESIAKKELKTLSEDYAEMGIDLLLTNEVIKEIPIIKTLLSIYNVGIGIKEQFTLKKIYKFLIQTGEASYEERDMFLKKINSYNIGDDFFEKLLFIIDKLDDDEKAYIIGNLFKSLIEEDITINEFHNLTSIVEASFYPYLKIYCLIRKKNINEDTRQKWLDIYREIGSTNVQKSLTRVGLLDESTEAEKWKNRAKDKEEIRVKIHRRGNDLLEKLTKYGFDEGIASTLYVPDISPQFIRSVSNFFNATEFIQYMKKHGYKFSVHSSDTEIIDLQNADKYSMIGLGKHISFEDALPIIKASKQFYDHLAYIYITSDKSNNDYDYYVHIGMQTTIATDKYKLNAIDKNGFSKILNAKSIEELHDSIRCYY